MADPKKDAAELDLDALAGKIGDKVGEVVGAAIARALPQPKKEEPPPAKDAPPVPLTADQVRTMIADAQKPLADQNEALKTELATLRTERAESDKQTKIRAKAAQDDLVRTAFDDAVSTGRMLPTERALLEKSLLHADAPAEVVTATLEEVRKRTPTARRPKLDAQIRSGEEDVPVDGDLRELVARGQADPGLSLKAAQIRAKVSKLPEKDRAAATQREWEAVYGEAQDATA